jgi:hypothetical protein
MAARSDRDCRATLRVAFARSGRAWLLAPVFLFATFGGLSPSARASTFRVLAASTQTFVTDGTRYVAWQVTEGSAIVVFDTRTGRRRAFPRPAGCRLFRPEENLLGPTAGAGRILLASCTDGQLVLNARTGAITALPELAGPFETGWWAVGKYYVEGLADPHVCPLVRGEPRNPAHCLALYNIATGALTYRPEALVGDRNRPGAPVICSSLRKKLLEGLRQENGTPGANYDNGLLAKPARREGDVQLDRCQGQTLLQGHGFPSNLDLRGGLLTWDTGHEVFDYEQEDTSHGAIAVYHPSTGRRDTYPLPSTITSIPIGHIRGVFGYSTHTANSLFWIAERRASNIVESSAVYIARLR